MDPPAQNPTTKMGEDTTGLQTQTLGIQAPLTSKGEPGSLGKDLRIISWYTFHQGLIVRLGMPARFLEFDNQQDSGVWWKKVSWVLTHYKKIWWFQKHRVKIKTYIKQMNQQSQENNFRV